jgi:NTE family protein
MEPPTAGDTKAREPGAIIATLLLQPQFQAFIAGLDQAALTELEMSLDWFGILAGETLFRQGDVASDIFFVTAGRLGVLIDTGLGEQLFAQILPGEVVGEMALISNEPRSATVVALRASELIRVPIQVAESLMSSSPPLTRYMLRLLASRLVSARRPLRKRATKAIVVMPIDSLPLERELADGLYREFVALSQRVGLVDGRGSQLTTEAIEAFEEQHDLVVYLADDRSSPWSRRCLGQSDRVIFIADAKSIPDEDADAKISAARAMHRPVDLVLLARPDASEPHGASAWLGRFVPQEIFHVRRGRTADYARVARLAIGRAVGVVFSGGGARACAHVGAIRAFHAAGIPVDLVGGTSMGAIVAAATAMAEHAEAIGELFHFAFVQNKPLNDYTLPLISLVRGRNMSRLLQDKFGDRTIENLWKVLFCVSANLSTGNTRIHRHGLVWRAVRASAAIPGILPPSIEDGEVLVDGGIMNNFPTDIMRSLARGPVIGIDVGSDMPLVAKATDIEEKSLLWRLRNRRTAVPGIVDILMRAGTVGSEEQRRASHAAADLLIQPRLDAVGSLTFDRFAVAIECGYRATMEAIERLDRTPDAGSVWSFPVK